MIISILVSCLLTIYLCPILFVCMTQARASDRFNGKIIKLLMLYGVVVLAIVDAEVIIVPNADDLGVALIPHGLVERVIIRGLHPFIDGFLRKNIEATPQGFHPSLLFELSLLSF